MTLSAPGRFLDYDEMQAIITAAKTLSPRHHAVCLLLATSGMRAEEVAKARWIDVYRDTDKRLGLNVHGKGGRNRQLWLTAQVWERIVALHGGTRSIDPNGQLAVHRAVLFDRLGPGPHPCHWCGRCDHRRTRLV